MDPRQQLEQLLARAQSALDARDAAQADLDAALDELRKFLEGAARPVEPAEPKPPAASATIDEEKLAHLRLGASKAGVPDPAVEKPAKAAPES